MRRESELKCWQLEGKYLKDFHLKVGSLKLWKYICTPLEIRMSNVT